MGTCFVSSKSDIGTAGWGRRKDVQAGFLPGDWKWHEWNESQVDRGDWAGTQAVPSVEAWTSGWI